MHPIAGANSRLVDSSKVCETNSALLVICVNCVSFLRDLGVCLQEKFDKLRLNLD